MPCLEVNSVLAIVNGEVDPEARNRIERHLADCQVCADLVAAAAGARPVLVDTAADPVQTSSGLPSGATVGRYVTLELVGRGGMGEVYAAYDPQLDRKIALKLLHERTPPGASGSAARARLLREAKAIARLSHPNVVVVHDAGEIDQRVFIAMEFIDGHTLQDWLGAAPRSWREVRDVFVAAGTGLAAAHEAGLVHRDFKPHNVMVGRDGSIRVMDFGLASDAAREHAGATAAIDTEGSDAPLTDVTLALTHAGMLIGTPLYMAPEQFLSRPADPRTDQFGFCVALYRALYRDWPFPTDSLAALTQAVITGAVREGPRKTNVPAFIRKLLLRGLRADPAERHPSMAALLAALRHDPTRTRRRVGAVVAAASVLAGALALQRATTQPDALCRVPTDRLSSAWELAPNGPRRAAIRRSFLATGRSFAEDTWKRVSEALDDYTRAWSEMYTEACEATHVRHEHSAEVLDLRMSCLRERQNDIKALTDLFMAPDGEVVSRAVRATSDLPPLARCADLAALKAAVRPPDDPETRARVDLLRQRAAGAHALFAGGRYLDAQRQIEPVIAEARTLGYDPVLAEALLELGRIRAKLLDSPQAEAALDEAMLLAEASHADRLLAEAAVAKVEALASGQRAEDLHRFLPRARATLKRIGGDARLESWIETDLGARLADQGNYEAALPYTRRALELKRRVLRADDPDLGMSLGNLASHLHGVGQSAEALERVEAALPILEKGFGVNHPEVATHVYNRGEIRLALGQTATAREDFTRALGIMQETLVPGHLHLSYALAGLGQVALAERRPADAVAFLERALEIREAAGMPANEAADLVFGLARALWESGRDRGRALRLAARAQKLVIPEKPQQRQHIEATIAKWRRAYRG